MHATTLILLAAMVTSVAVFTALRFRLGSVPAPIAPARGSAAAGILYAFTFAFAPWAKESASRHLPSYLAGIAYHVAVFAGLVRLAVSLVGPSLPSLANGVIAVLAGCGLACGLALLVKRCTDRRLRAVSVPEDYFANALVNLMLAATLAAALRPSTLPVFQIVGAVLVLYAPLGKLRHMLFLLTSRGVLGATFGRRGVRPTAVRSRSDHG